MNKSNTEISTEKLHKNFEGILALIEEINRSKTILLNKIIEFKTMYTDLVKKNKTKIFIFCLDSLYFQYKSSMMDLDAMENNRKFIMNRMYCDYFKLYNLIVSDVNDKKLLQIELKSYPPYKDLEVLYEYNLESIINIHNDILDIIKKLYEKLKNNKSGVEEHVERKSVVSISNFLNTLKFENGLLENQIMLYINYISFFHFTQKKMFIKLYSKMTDFNKDIEEYKNFNRVISIDDINSLNSDSDNYDENEVLPDEININENNIIQNYDLTEENIKNLSLKNENIEEYTFGNF